MGSAVPRLALVHTAFVDSRKAMEPETPQTPQVTCPAEHCMYWTQWTSKLHTIGTNQYAPSGGERNIDIAGHGFGK